MHKNHFATQKMLLVSFCIQESIPKMLLVSFCIQEIIPYNTTPTFQEVGGVA